MSNVPILGQNGPDRFDREYGGVYRREETARGDLQDSEILRLEQITKKLMERYETRSFLPEEFEREAKDRFHDAGFAIEVAWYKFAKNGKTVEGGLAPDITIVGRVEKTAFDHDQKVHEVTRNILDLDQPTGVIKSEATGLNGGH